MYESQDANGRMIVASTSREAVLRDFVRNTSTKRVFEDPYGDRRLIAERREPTSIPVCTIQWVSLETGLPTPDQNPAVGMVHTEGHVVDYSRFGGDAYHYHPPSADYPICEGHLRYFHDQKLARHHWVYVPFEKGE